MGRACRFEIGGSGRDRRSDHLLQCAPLDGSADHPEPRVAPVPGSAERVSRVDPRRTRHPWLSSSLLVDADRGRRAQSGGGPGRLFMITARVLLEHHGNPVLVSLIEHLWRDEYALPRGNANVLVKLDLQCRLLCCDSPLSLMHSSVT